MALFKRKFTKIDPKTGKKVVDRKTGKPKQFLTDKWYGQYRDLGGRLHRVPLATDKVAAAQMLADLVKQSERGLSGVADPFAKHTWRPLAEHVNDFEKSTKADGTTEKQASLASGRLRAIFAGCEFQFIADINSDKVSTWLSDQRATRPRFGVATSNHYMRAMTTFCNWLADPKRGKRCAINPYGKAPVLEESVDVRRQRRALSEDEIAWMLDSTENGPVIGEISGPDRAMLYRVALTTGLRASELKSLSAHSFDLGSSRPTVTVEACYSKHRRKDVLPLHPDMVPRLSEWLTEKTGVEADKPAILSLKGTPAGNAGRLWTGSAVKERRCAETIRRDLKAARKRWIDAAPDAKAKAERERSDFLLYQTRAGYADFHAQRHTYITRIMRSVSKAHHAQQLARHANMKQTLRYTHTEADELAQAIQQVPSLPTQPAALATAVAVG